MLIIRIAHLTLNKFLLAFLIGLTIPFLGFGQNNQEDFNALVDRVIKEKPIDYPLLEKTFRFHKNDTLKMSFLVQKSKELDYLVGQSFAQTMLGIYYRNKSKI